MEGDHVWEEKGVIVKDLKYVWCNIRLYTSEQDECKMIGYPVSEKNYFDIIFMISKYLRR